APEAIPVARGTGLVQLEADQTARQSRCGLRRQGRAADELALVELDDPREARLERRRGGVHVGATERQPGLEAQGITRAEAGGEAASPHGALQESVPQRAGRGRLHEDLEPVLARVARP